MERKKNHISGGIERDNSIIGINLSERAGVVKLVQIGVWRRCTYDWLANRISPAALVKLTGSFLSKGVGGRDCPPDRGPLASIYYPCDSPNSTLTGADDAPDGDIKVSSSIIPNAP